jgi:uncharacterized protein
MSTIMISGCFLLRGRVIEPYLADLEAGRARQVWAEAEHTVESKVFGPHFEALAAEWVAR